jgi:hypothetical protein
VDVIAMMAAGRIEGVTWSELLAMLKPSSPIYLEPLRDAERVCRS